MVVGSEMRPRGMIARVSTCWSWRRTPLAESVCAKAGCLLDLDAQDWGGMMAAEESEANFL